MKLPKLHLRDLFWLMLVWANVVALLRSNVGGGATMFAGDHAP